MKLFSMKKLFSDRLKFKVIKEDPTLTRKHYIQNVNTIFKRNKISDAEKKQLDQWKQN